MVLTLVTSFTSLIIVIPKAVILTIGTAVRTADSRTAVFVVIAVFTTLIGLIPEALAGGIVVAAVPRMKMNTWTRHDRHFR